MRMSVKTLTEISLTIALAFLLSLVKLWQMPQGGGISLVMLPILYLALTRGWQAGTLAGFCFGLLHILQSSFFYHPLQWFLDYPLAYGLLGLAGLCQGTHWHNILAGTLIGVAGRFMAHFVSGLMFIHLFLAHPPQHVARYSAWYNLSYLGPETVLMLILLPLVFKLQLRRH